MVLWIHGRVIASEHPAGHEVGSLPSLTKGGRRA
jgi:hypothetical protein